MINTRVSLSVLLATALACACGDRATGPTPVPPPPTSVVVLLSSSPHRDDGAITVTVYGPMHQDNINTFKPVSDYFLFLRGTSESEMRVTLVGTVLPGSLFRFYLAPGARLSDYTAAVSHAATLTDSLRADVSGYHVTLMTVPPQQSRTELATAKQRP